MKSCESYRPQLSAFLDNEISAADTQRLHAHLQQCAECHREWILLQELDCQLTDVLTITRADVKIAKIEQSRTKGTVQGGRRKSPAWWSIIAAIAATIALASVTLRNLPAPPNSNPVDTQIIASLTNATGPIEVLAPGSSDWKIVQPAELCELVAGTRVRTGADVICEFQTTDDAKIRLNESAELLWTGKRQLELRIGQAWYESSNTSTLQLDAAFQNQAIASFQCPSASQVQCVAEPKKATFSSIAPTNGVASCSVGNSNYDVDPGQTIAVGPTPGQQPVDRAADELAKSKIWQLPLLAASSASSNAELFPSLSRMLAPIGMTKARHLNEQQIRRLGPRGAVPLLIFATDPSSLNEPSLRRTAARLGCDLADAKAIRWLNQLETDSDADIAAYAKNAIRRVTRETK